MAAVNDKLFPCLKQAKYKGFTITAMLTYKLMDSWKSINFDRLNDDTPFNLRIHLLPPSLFAEINGGAKSQNYLLNVALGF